MNKYVATLRPKEARLLECKKVSNSIKESTEAIRQMGRILLLSKQQAKNKKVSISKATKQASKKNKNASKETQVDVYVRIEESQLVNCGSACN